ncbi:MAG: hypothetical protein K8S56_08235 [Candidatus Cloacimonetes bacterium]|nr:hypothetical protein [Candidatus Cloacimonadota bacterium]
MQISNEVKGIMPVLERIKELILEVSGFFEEKESSKAPKSFEQAMSQMTEVRKLINNLPGTLEKSQQLIQMVIRSIQSSRSELKKSVDGLIKKTGVQLQKVTSTTEEATNKILDAAESLDIEQEKIIELIQSVKSKFKTQSCIEDDFSQLIKMIQANQETAFTIIDYLQFQDITAQQIAAAYALLADTEKTLRSVSDMFSDFDSESTVKSSALLDVDEKTFNPDATFRDQADVQAAIDEMFHKGDESVEIPDPTNDKETDIDALFSDVKSGVSKEKKKTDDEDDDEPTSQDEIDDLFS